MSKTLSYTTENASIKSGTFIFQLLWNSSKETQVENPQIKQVVRRSKKNHTHSNVVQLKY